MAKTIKIFKLAVLVLLLVPQISASSLEELEKENGQLKYEQGQLTQELAQLREIVSALQAQMKTKVDVSDLTVMLNDTEELEARVSDLEESVSDLEAGFVMLTDDMDNVESANLLQDERINTLETEISDNENDIEELVDISNGLTTQVSDLQEDVASLEQRVGDLESGGGGGNVTDLEERVDTLEEVTSQLTDDVSSLEDNDVTQDERISSIEEDVMSLDQRVDDLESGGGGGGNATDYSDSIFMAVLTASQTSTQNPLIFNNAVINPGGHYNTTTGFYTVPYNGIYQFSIHLAAYSLSTGVYFYLDIDDSASDSHAATWTNELYESTTILLELTTGQTVHVRMYDGAYGASSGFHSYFSGYLVSPN